MKTAKKQPKQGEGITFVTRELSFRIPLPVTELRTYGSSDEYYVCPRCKLTLDREYMAYCDRCGQCLVWY